MITDQDDNAFPSGTIANGLSKREYFAAMAMQGLLSNPDHRSDSRSCHEQIAKKALSMADELIKSLNEQEIK